MSYLVFFTISISLIFAATVSCYPCIEKVYVGGTAGQLYISTMGGEFKRRNPYLDFGINAIAATFSNVYAATENGLAVSHDGGDNWKRVQLNPGGKSQWVSSVFVRGDNVYATAGVADEEGTRFCMSNDKGDTWPINIRFDPNQHGLLRAVYANDKRVYMGTQTRGLAVSEDNGKTWKYIGVEQGLAGNQVRAIAGEGGKVFVGSDKGLISISEDYGETWRIQNTTQRGVITSIVVKVDKVYVTSTISGLSISNDGGKTWLNKLNLMVFRAIGPLQWAQSEVRSMSALIMRE